MRTLFTYLLLTITLVLHAQTWTEVKTSGEYLWGEGQGATVAEADRQALADLTSRIVVHVCRTSTSWTRKRQREERWTRHRMSPVG